MKNIKIPQISTALLAVLLLTSCRENISYGNGSDNGVTDITTLEQTQTEQSSAPSSIQDTASTIITDNNDVILENYSVDENNNLTLTITNNSTVDLGYIYIFNLYQNGAALDYKEGFGICGTPDNFPAGETITLTFNLDYMFGDSLNGKYDLIMEFKDRKNLFENNAKVFILKTVIELEKINDVPPEEPNSTIIWDNGDEMTTQQIENQDLEQTEFIPSEFLIDYELSYTEDGNVIVYYQNNCNYEVSFGRHYKLYDSNGNLVPFKNGGVFTEDAMLMYPGGSNQLHVYLGEPYFDKLDNGDYIVAHSLHGQETQIIEIPITINK